MIVIQTTLWVAVRVRRYRALMAPPERLTSNAGSDDVIRSRRMNACLNMQLCGRWRGWSFGPAAILDHAHHPLACR